MIEIEKERFEAWLFSQNPHAVFSYNSRSDCMICQFLRTQTREPVDVWPKVYAVGERECVARRIVNPCLTLAGVDELLKAYRPLPAFLIQLQEAYLVYHPCPWGSGQTASLPFYSFGQVQCCWVKLFGKPGALNKEPKKASTRPSEPVAA